MAYRRFRLNDDGKKPQHRPTAAALQYDSGHDMAPRVVASGQGKIAEQILTLARQNNIPVYDDPLLAAALSSVELGQEIPPELYLVVAEVLAYLYRVAGKRASGGRV
jgi:flagellar biosynthesis protein